MKQIFNQQSFSGGINQQVDTTRIGKDEYPLLINGRNRYDTVEPINVPSEIKDSNLPVDEKIQGLRAAGNVLIVFIGGKAYFKNWEYPNSTFKQIEGVNLDPEVDVIFSEIVPISFQNFLRIPENRDANRNTDVILTSIIDTSPQGIVVQDGVNRPFFIESTMIARPLQAYQEWGSNSREYVPIGRQMLWHNGILYIVSKDGLRLYRSVTGRPLDFMVNITPVVGGRFGTEEEGGAETVAHSVDYEFITSINKLNTDDGALFVSNNKASYAVIPLYERTDLIFGEPTFANRFLFSAGSISPFSFIELLGDNAFVDFNGLRSFNAVNQLKNEGQNSPFSKKLGRILQGIQQTYAVSINYDNYALFAVQTIYGHGIIVFDTLSNTFSALDVFPNIGQIKQFSEIKTSSTRRLFFITVDNKLYEYFGSSEVATCQIYVGEWSSNNPEIEQHISQLKCVFIDVLDDGIVNAQTYIDGRLAKSLESTVEKQIELEAENLVVPFGESNADKVKILSFDFGRATVGWKVGFLISWNFKAKLSHISAITNTQNNINSVETAAKTFARNKALFNL